MEIFLRLLILFMIGCFSGWILEVFWRRFFSAPKVWKNPGFLNGPYLPLYGFGTVLLFAISEIPTPFFVKVILFCVVMTLIELVTGLVFIKGMKIKLWDYSKLWGNWLGIICPLYSFLWTILGVAFYFLIYPNLAVIVNFIMLNHYMYLLIGFFYGIFAIDLAISFNVSSKVKNLVEASRISIQFEELKVELRKKIKADGKNSSFLFPFKNSDVNFGGAIKEQVAKLKEQRLLEDEEKERKRILKENRKNSMK